MPSALDYLNVRPPISPLGQFFPQPAASPQEEALRNQLEGRSASPVQPPPEYAMAGMTQDPQGFMDQVQKIRTDLQTQKAIKGVSELDFNSKDYSPSVARLVSKYPLASQNPAFLNILKMKEFSGQQSKNTNYDEKASSAIKDFLSIPEDDPNYDQKYQQFIQSQDPEVLSHPRMGSLIERGMHNSSVIRSKKDARQQELATVKKEARLHGIDPNKYDNIDDLNSVIADQMAQSGQRKELSDLFRSQPELRKEYATAMSHLRAPTEGIEFDQEKMDAVGKTKPQDMTKEDWARGDYLAKQKRLQKARSLNDEIALSVGYNPMRGVGTQVDGVSPENQSTESVPTQAAPVAATPIPLAAPPQAAPLSFAQKKQAEMDALKTAVTGATSSFKDDTSAKWAKAKGDLESSLKKAGFTDADLDGIYRSVIAGENLPDEEAQATPMGAVGDAIGLPPRVSVAEHVLQKAGLAPGTASGLTVPSPIGIPGVKWDVHNQYLLEELAKERLGVGSANPVPLDPKTASLRSKYKY